MPGRSVISHIVGGFAVGLFVSAGGLVGCATTPTDEGVNNGLANLAPDGDAEAGAGLDPSEMTDAEIAEQMAWSLDAFDDYLNGEQRAVGTNTNPGVVADADQDDPAIPVEDLDENDAVAEAATDPDPVAEAEPDPEQRARELAAELETLIRETTDDPYTLAIRLAGLLAGEPDAADRLRAIADTLPADQRGVVHAVAAILGETDTDPSSLTALLVERALELDEARPIRIGQLALCSRVEGFGRYTELPSTGFVAGSPVRMIVYTEVEHFDRVAIADTGRRRAGGDLAIEDGWEVRLSQELQLYHEADGLLAWRRPEEVTSYRSRSKPRDYFIVDQITLPRTLTVGAYRLKVVLRDLADRSVDERIIPIRVVADPELARAAP